MGLGVGSVVVDIIGNMSGLTRTLSQAENSINSFARTTGKKMQQVGSSLTKKITLPVVGLATAAGKTRIDFDKAMSNVQATSGATEAQLDELAQTARKMAASSKFTAKESADALNYMALAGWDTYEMMDGLEGIMNAAAASGADLAQVSDIVTDGLSAFGMTAKESTHFADVLAKTQASANTDILQMGESFKYVGTLAGAMNFSIEDVSIALGAMANAGTKASQAGTTLRGLFGRLTKPTKESAMAIKALGLEIEDSDGKMKPLRDIMKQLRDGFDGLTEAEKNSYAAMLAGRPGMSGLLALVGETDEAFAELTKDIDDSSGAAKKMSDTKMSNFAGQIDLIKSKLTELGLQITDKGTLLDKLMTTIAETLQRTLDWLDTLSQEQKNQIVKWALIAAAVGPVLWIIGKLISFVPTIVMLFKAFGIVVNILAYGLQLLVGLFLFLISPIGLVVVAIGALIAIGYLVYKNWDWVKKQLLIMWENLKKAWNDSVQDIKDALESFRKKMKDFWDGVGKTFRNAIEKIKEWWTDLKERTARKWDEIKQAIKDKVNGIVEDVKALPGKIILALFKKANDVKNAFADMFKFKIPHIKLPEFKVSGKFSLMPPQVPSIGIKWHKNGGILNGPTLIGAGEAGKEAVVPLSGLASHAIATELQKLGAGSQNGVTNITINGYQKDPEELANMVIKKMDRQVYRRNFNRG